MRGRELATLPCAAILHVRHRINRNELGIRADEDKLAATRPPAAGRTLLVIDRNVVHPLTSFAVYYNKICPAYDASAPPLTPLTAL